MLEVVQEAEGFAKPPLLLEKSLRIQSHQISSIPRAVIIDLAGLTCLKPIVKMLIDHHGQFEVKMCSVGGDPSRIGRTAHGGDRCTSQDFAAQTYL